jgi:hypothetical protein
MLPCLLLISIIPALIAIAPIVKGVDLLNFEPLTDFYYVEKSVSLTLIGAGSVMLILPVLFLIGWCLLAIRNHRDVRSVFMIWLSMIAYLGACVALFTCAGMLYNKTGLEPQLTARWNSTNITIHQTIEKKYGCCGWTELPACCNKTVIGTVCCIGARYGYNQCFSNWDPYNQKITTCIHNVTLLYDDINDSCAWWAIWSGIVAFFAIILSLLMLTSKDKYIKIEYSSPQPMPVFAPPPPKPRLYGVYEIT